MKTRIYCSNCGTWYHKDEVIIEIGNDPQSEFKENDPLEETTT